ncbi:MAG TPA: SoxY-related AACIE arm protein [Beijerinckiaceae bacterium]|jgi:sulfur-oxidizing protein SoxY
MTDAGRDGKTLAGLSRRTILGAGAALVVLGRPSAAQATPESMAAALKQFTQGGSVQEGRVRLDLPPLVENGNSVPVTIAVDSPMTEADHVRRIALFNQKNPQPEVVRFTLGPRAGRAAVSTRIRLADTQTVIAVAELSDGSFWSARADVIVTLAACVES